MFSPMASAAFRANFPVLKEFRKKIQMDYTLNIVLYKRKCVKRMSSIQDLSYHLLPSNLASSLQVELPAPRSLSPSQSSLTSRSRPFQIIKALLVNQDFASRIAEPFSLCFIIREWRRTNFVIIFKYLLRISALQEKFQDYSIFQVKARDLFLPQLQSLQCSSESRYRL